MRIYAHDTVLANCESHGEYSQAVFSRGENEMRSRCPVCRHLDEMAEYLSRYPFMDFPEWTSGYSLNDGYMSRILSGTKNYIVSGPTRSVTTAIRANMHTSGGSVGYIRVNGVIDALSRDMANRRLIDCAYQEAETLVYSTGLMVSEQWVGEVVRAVNLRQSRKTIILTEWTLAQLREALGSVVSTHLSRHGFSFVLTVVADMR